MNESEFEALLNADFARPSGRAVAPELVAGVMDRVQRRRRARRAVLAMATLAGCGVTAAVVVATGMTGLVSRTLANLGPEPTLIDPSICLGVGFFLMLLAAARNEVREL